MKNRYSSLILLLFCCLFISIFFNKLHAQQPLLDGATIIEQSGTPLDLIIKNDTVYLLFTPINSTIATVNRYHYCNYDLIDSKSINGLGRPESGYIHVDDNNVHLFIADEANLSYTALDKGLNLAQTTVLNSDQTDLNISLDDIEFVNGVAHLVGTTGANLPATNGTTFTVSTGYSYYGVAPDAYYLQFDLVSKSILHATYLGGSEVDNHCVIKIMNGIAHIAMWTTSDGVMTTNGSTHSGGDDYYYYYYGLVSDVLVYRIDVATASFLDVAYVGGTGNDQSKNIDVLDGKTIISGFTLSTDYPGNFNADFQTDFVTYLDTSLNIVSSNTVLSASGFSFYSSETTTDDSYLYTASEVFQYSNTQITNGSTYGFDRRIYLRKFDAVGNLVFGHFVEGSNLIDLQVANDKIHLLSVPNNISTSLFSSDGYFPPVINRQASYYSSFDLQGNLLSSIFNPISTRPKNSGQNFTNRLFIEDTRTTIYGYSNFNPLMSTNGTVFVSSSSYQGIASYENCPMMGICYTPTYLGTTSTTLSPASQDVCSFGFVQEVLGGDFFMEGSSYPTINIDGVPVTQRDIKPTFQWQKAFSANGPWSDIPGAQSKNYSPGPLGTTTCFRRMAFSHPCCGDSLLQTSDVHCINISSNVAPVIDAGGIYNSCPTTPVSLVSTTTGGVAPYSYNWAASNSSTLGTSSSVSVTSNDIGGIVYTVTVTDDVGCSQIDQAIVNIYAADAGPNVVVCDSIPIGGTPPPGLSGVSYSWSPSTGLSCPTCPLTYVSPTQTTTYTLTMTLPVTGGGTCSTTDDVTVTNIAPANLNFAGPDKTFCATGNSFGQVGLPGVGGYTYSWSSPHLFTNPSNPQGNIDFSKWSSSEPNPITLYLTVKRQDCTWVDEVEVTIIDANAGNTACSGTSIGTPDTTPSINETYSWVQLSGDGTITGPTNQAQTTITPPTIPSSYELTVEYNGIVCTDIVSVLPCVPTTCSANISMNGGCDAFLQGDTTYLTVTNPTGSYSYEWSPTAGLSSPTGNSVYLTDSISRVYTVTVTSLSNPLEVCTATVSTNRGPFTIPTFSAPDVSACMGDSVNIGGPDDPGLNFSWSPTTGLSDPNISNPKVLADTTTQYLVTVTNGSGCSIKDTVLLTVLGVAANAGPDHFICEFGVIQLGAPAEPNVDYSWMPLANWQNGTSDTSAQPEALVAINTTFVLTTLDQQSGCTNTDTALVTVGPPIPPFSMPNIDFCVSGGAFDLGMGAPSGMDAYSWSPGNLLVDSTVQMPTLIDPPPSKIITFTLTVTNNVGCTADVTQTITPVVNEPDAGTSQVLCVGESVQIGDANPPMNSSIISWSPTTGLDDPMSPNPTFTATTVGSFVYTVTRTDATCTSSASITIDVNDYELPVLTPSFIVCENACIAIGTDAEAGVTYSWTPTTGLNDPASANPTACVTQNTTYELIATGPDGCKDTATVDMVIGNDIPTFTMPDINYCTSGGALMLGANAPAGMAQYSWSPANLLVNPTFHTPTTLDPPPSSPVTFVLTVTNASGCERVATQSIIPVVKPLAGGAKVLCFGESTSIGNILNAVGPNISYSWSPTTGLNDPTSPNPTFTASAAGSFVYTLTKTDNGCIADASINIEVKDKLLSFIPPTTACQNSCVAIGIAPESGLSYFWSPTTGLDDPNSSNPVACVTQDIVYELTVVDLNGCSDKIAVPVFLHSVPAPTVVVNDLIICSTDSSSSFSITVSPPGNYFYNWGPNDNALVSLYTSSPVVFPNFVGSKTYSVTVTNGTTGCASVGAANLTIEVCPIIDFDNDGIPDDVDIDDDNDGIVDVEEYECGSGTIFGNSCPMSDPSGDDDGDLILNYEDPDWADCGVLNSFDICSSVDLDGDGIPNHFDLDSDGDGISDIIEAGGIDPDGDGQVSYPIPGDPTSMNDADEDGLSDDPVFDSTGDGIADVPADIHPNGPITSSSLPIPNSEGTGAPNFHDLDSDDDGIPDSVEAAFSTNNLDSDNDGAPDYIDLDSDNDGINDIVEAGGVDADQNGLIDSPMAENSLFLPTDTDGDMLPDYLEVDSDNDGRTDISNTQNFTLDGDGDGVIDNITDPDQDGIPNIVDGLPADWGDAVRGVYVQVRLLLEGPYLSATDLMTDNLRATGLLPIDEPYTGLGYTLDGWERVSPSVFTSTGADAIVDWVVLELRDAGDFSVTIGTRAALLQADGDVVDLDGLSNVLFDNAPDGNYYIVARHRNHLDIMTPGSISLSQTSALHDFTTGSAFSNSSTMVQKNLGGGKFGMFSCDFNNTGFIDAQDRSDAWNFRNQMGYLIQDADFDGECGASDRSNCWNNRNLFSQVP